MGDVVRVRYFAIAVGVAFAAGCTQPPAVVESIPWTGPAPVLTTEAKSAPFRLYTHCDIRFVRYNGQAWAAEREYPDPTRAPGPDGSTAYDGYISGRMVEVDERTLRFVTDPGFVIGEPAEVVFHPTTAEIPLCA
ncbi:hypothetical protein LV79_001611 [Actinokineospora globicatena]|nr:hypothetical protein [Actinokineospora globicatena]GLW76405.1 hypothetical protein Aglo01_08870 [Actinokineospora globicatena]GLW83240.1 hypothetical protein Aglo02_08800 [Actinokineospora globicatena]